MFSVKVKNYKCFGGEHQGFDCISFINLIIGKNNSGKSALVDLIRYAIEPFDSSNFDHKGALPEFLITDALSETEIAQVFPQGTSGGTIPGPNHWEYGKRWVGKRIAWKSTPKDKTFFSIDPPFDFADRHRFQTALVNVKKHVLEGRTFKKLSAERDVVDEPDGAPMLLRSSGQGATTIIKNFLTKADLPNGLVNEVVLNNLNKIFYPEVAFDRIFAKQLQTNQWEIFLHEKKKGKDIPISLSGSGIKTILLVLCHLFLIPFLEKKKLHEYVFAFEELENNLHPALQRKLLFFLEEIAVNNRTIFFLTSHSSVAIDLFSKSRNAKMFHIVHDGESAVVKNVKTYIEHSGILDDLDIRASDVLQANGIVWVEGPSDRIYLNRWIGLISDDRVREGAHYQCIHYGGRLLAHLTANDEVGSVAGTNILSVNRNSAMMIDSDKKNEKDDLNETKKRLISEMSKINALVWLTEGIEIENYIPVSVLQKAFPGDVFPELEFFTSFSDYLKQNSSNAFKVFSRSKALFAEQLSAHFSIEDIESSSILKKKLDQLCVRIKTWNKLS